MVLLGLSCFWAPLGALVLDFNNIKSSADLPGARKVKRSWGGGCCSFLAGGVLALSVSEWFRLTSEVSYLKGQFRNWEEDLVESSSLSTNILNKPCGFSGH